MKNKLWLVQIPFILLFTAAFYINDMGAHGDLNNGFLREKVRPGLSRVAAIFSDLKFKLRGPHPPKNKIVVVEVDSPSIDAYGRWPWHRNVIAKLIDDIFRDGAKVVGLDIVFSEADRRVPPELAQILGQKKLGGIAQAFETDPMLASVVQKYHDRLVLGWAGDPVCQPAYGAPEDCPVTDPQAIAQVPPGFEKFAIPLFLSTPAFDVTKTAIMSVLTPLANLPEFNAVADHSGYFQAFPDSDGYIRRTALFMMMNGKPYPSLPLEMARVGMDEALKVELAPDGRVKTLGFARSGRDVPVTPLGSMEINFRGPGRTFTYVPVTDVLREDNLVKDAMDRRLAGLPLTEVLKDAYVLIGVSALGVFDMRAFPFDSNVAGVEGHANILDNLLSGDPLVQGAAGYGSRIILLLMILGALVFSYFTQKLEAIPALGLFLFTIFAFGLIDEKVLFAHNYEWDTSFLYLEMTSLFAFTLAVKYVVEERSKKFIKSAFTKYLAPAVVDQIIKDPDKLQLGGEKKELTILFSDIRSFTTMSEKMDAKTLASFLNEYLSVMTGLVFTNGGTLDKYIGDAVMAFWGAPLELPNHASLACSAAIQMMKSLREIQPKFKEKYNIDVNIGIGINSGMVNVGNMGSTQNFEYTVIGDSVNLASRLEGLTKEYRSSILTTRFTFDDIAGAKLAPPQHRTLDFVKVKGKKKAVELIQVFDRDYPTEPLAAFEEARKLYEKQQWDAAIAKFRLASEMLEKALGAKDGPAEMFIERCEEFKRTPPEKDWDGAWEMHSK